MLLSDISRWWQMRHPRGQFQKGFQQALDDVLVIRLRLVHMHAPENADFKAGYMTALRELRMGVDASAAEADMYSSKAMPKQLHEFRLAAEEGASYG